MRETSTTAPIEITLIVEGAQDANSVRFLLEVADKIREEYGLAIRVDMTSNVAFEPLMGWVHMFPNPLGPLSTSYSSPGDTGYVILKDGSQVRVVIRGSCDKQNLERALVEAALQALAREEGDLEAFEESRNKLGSDPGSFAAGEYVVFSAAA